MATNNCINNTGKITTFSSSGTWIKDARTIAVTAYGWSAGGGGGSGRRGTSTLSSGGGGSAAGGYFCEYIIPATAFDSSVTITIGAGGTGSAGKTTDDTSGSQGGYGGSSWIENSDVALGFDNTNFGSGGNETGGSGGTQKTRTMTNGLTISSRAGANGNIIAGSTAPVTYAYAFPTGGGGGGGADSVVNRDGGKGGDILIQNTAINVALGGTGGSSGSPNGGNGIGGYVTGYTAIGSVVAGTGGGGGAGQGSGNNPGNGGNGGTPGGGGGGGGGSLNGTNSGSGGNGGDGYIVIIEYF